MNPLSLEAAITSLYQIAGMLKHPATPKLFSDETSRFQQYPEVAQAIYKKIGSTFLDDVATFVFHASDEPIEELRTYRNIGVNASKLAIKRLLVKAGDELERQLLQFDVKISKSAKRFSVPSDSTILKSALALIGGANHAALNATISSWTNPSSEEFKVGVRLTYLNHLIGAMYRWFEAKDSMLNPINDNLIERYLDYAMGRGRDYWEQGYPYDILVHDKYISRELNPKDGIDCLGFDERYVSTHTAAKNGGLPVELVHQHVDLIFTQRCLDKPQKAANQG